MYFGMFTHSSDTRVHILYVYDKIMMIASILEFNNYIFFIIIKQNENDLHRIK